MAQKHKQWIKLLVKILVIIILGSLWTFESSGATEMTNTDSTGADYYWVGGGGNWSDLSHWATSSGGIQKHKTLPDSTNNVHFDENSFMSLHDTVIVDVDVLKCRDMDWTGVKFKPTLAGDTTTMMHCYGSLKLTKEMVYDYEGKWIHLLSNETAQTIDLAGHYLSNNILFKGEGEWLLAGEFKTHGQVDHSNGTLDTQGHDLTIGQIYTSHTNAYIQTQEPTNSILKLRDSQFLITAENPESPGGMIFNDKVVAGTSTLIVPGDFYIATESDLYDLMFLERKTLLNHGLFILKEEIPKEFHNITFQHSAKITVSPNNKPLAEMTIHKLQFQGDARIQMGPLRVDSLIFSPGNEYEFTSIMGSKLHITDYLFATGTSCKPITIADDLLSVVWVTEPTTFFVENGIITGDYLSLKNIKVDGGATFYAGEHSEDLGGNSGWIFETDPEYQDGILGSDQELTGEPIVLDANHFNPKISYLWNTGETTPSIEVNSCGQYSVQVFFAEGCITYDTVHVFSVDVLSNDVLSNVTHATCGQKGEVEIDRSRLAYISSPYQVTLTDFISGQALMLSDETSTFEGLTEGSYELQIEDADGCRYVLADEISIELDESSCRSSVISPDFGETLTVPFVGLVKIYDRNGKLIRKFDAPGEWDGRDQYGKVVPIGLYLLISDENRNEIIEVTVVR